METPTPWYHRKAGNVLIWTASVMLALVYLIAGSGKFDPDGNLAESFLAWGYPLWFLFIVGTLEVLGGLALLIPRLAFYAALVLMAVMVGATFTHLLNYDSMGLPLLPLGMMLVLSLIAVARRPLRIAG